MNKKLIIEAAEVFVSGLDFEQEVPPTIQELYELLVTHFLAYVKEKEGKELVKIVGGDEDLADEWVKGYTEERNVTKDGLLSTGFVYGIATGREQSRKELELKDALIKVLEEQSASRLQRINDLYRRL